MVGGERHYLQLGGAQALTPFILLGTVLHSSGSFPHMQILISIQTIFEMGMFNSLRFSFLGTPLSIFCHDSPSHLGLWTLSSISSTASVLGSACMPSPAPQPCRLSQGGKVGHLRLTLLPIEHHGPTVLYL